MSVPRNGTSLTGHQYENFTESSCIRHLTTLPQHAAFNGLAERAVSTVKKRLMQQTEKGLGLKLCYFVINFQVDPFETSRVWRRCSNAQSGHASIPCNRARKNRLSQKACNEEAICVHEAGIQNRKTQPRHLKPLTVTPLTWDFLTGVDAGGTWITFLGEGFPP